MEAARIFLRPKVKEQKHNSCRYQSLDFLDFLDFKLDFNFWAGVGVRSLAVTSCPKAIDQPQRNGPDFSAAVGELPTRCAGANLWDGGKFTNPKIHQIFRLQQKSTVDPTHSCKMAWVGDCEWVSDKPTLFQSCMFHRGQTLGYFGFSLGRLGLKRDMSEVTNCLRRSRCLRRKICISSVGSWHRGV